MNSQNIDNSPKLSRASYKSSKASTSSQFGHVINDVSTSNASTRQPTPGASESIALFEASLDTFKRSKSNLASIEGSKSEHQEKSTAPTEREKENKGAFADYSRQVKEDNGTEFEHGSRHSRHSSKFPPAGQLPTWQNGTTTFNKPPLEHRRTLYNPVALGAAGKAHHTSKTHVSAGKGGNPNQRAWGRAKRESVADIEGLLNEFGQSDFGSYARKPRDEYVFILITIYAMCPK